MNILPSIIPAKRRVRRKRRVVSNTATPVSGPQILSVTAGEDPTQMIVTLSVGVQSIAENAEALKVYLPGVYWVQPIEVDLAEPGVTTAVVVFAEDVSAATEWVVPAPDVWIFADDAVLELPLSGTVG
jgi:hypothetical protein